jgi:hypothetical protein
MKKIVKILLRAFSLVSLVVLVFSAGVLTKITGGDTEKKDQSKNSDSESLLSAFGLADTAYADVAPGPGPVDPGDCPGPGDCGPD